LFGGYRFWAKAGEAFYLDAVDHSAKDAGGGHSHGLLMQLK